MMGIGGNIDVKRLALVLLGVVLGVTFILACPDVGLSRQGIICLGILLGAVVWWVGNVFPAYATALVMVVLFAIAGGIDTKVALSAFSSDTWWLLMAAFGLGAGMKQSGLLSRIAQAIVRAFPNTYAAQAVGLVAAGTVVGPLVPSLAVKVMMLTPLALEIGETLGYERYGKPMQGLFLAMFTGVRNAAPALLSASVIGYCLLGLLPADVKAQFDLLHWLLAALPWFVLVTVLNYLAIVVLYKPASDAGDGIRPPKPESAPCAKSGANSDGNSNHVDSGDLSDEKGSSSRGVLQNKSAPMTRYEKRMCLIIMVTVALWITEPLHHVAAHIVAMGAFALVAACGILGKGGLREGISWEALVFVGVAISLANVFEVAGIQDWIVVAAGPAFQAVAGNPYLFVLGAAAITLVARFVIVSEMAYLNIVMVFLVPLSVSAGINPWVIGFAMYAVITPWFTLYQSATYLAAFYSVDGKMVRHADMARYCVLYTLICLAGLVASVPYWQWMGLL